MNEGREHTEAPVRTEVLVNLPQDRAFSAFVEKFSDWWPLHHYHIGPDPDRAFFEPRAGGRWYERSKGGTESEWGRVIHFEPPHRLVLTWNISANWQHDPALGTVVEVRFIASGPDATRVELEHRELERYGADAARMRSIFASGGGWGNILRHFAEAVADR